jgi:MraZ protein
MMAKEELCFLGEYEHALDSQRRIAIPKQWRCKDGDTRFFLVPGRNSTLQLRTYESFKDFLNKAMKVSSANAEASLALARYGSRAQECSCDKQGRIQISQRLAEYAGLKEQAVLVGSFSSIQVWTPENWDKYQVSDESYLDEVQKIDESGDDFLEALQGTLGKFK